MADGDGGGERLAQREGRRRLDGRAGLEKLFLKGGHRSRSCGETHKTPLRMSMSSWEPSNSVTQILYILSRAPSVVFLSLGKQQAYFKQEH